MTSPPNIASSRPHKMGGGVVVIFESALKQRLKKFWSSRDGLPWPHCSFILQLFTGPLALTLAFRYIFWICGWRGAFLSILPSLWPKSCRMEPCPCFFNNTLPIAVFYFSVLSLQLLVLSSTARKSLGSHLTADELEHCHQDPSAPTLDYTKKVRHLRYSSWVTVVRLNHGVGIAACSNGRQEGIWQ